MKIHNLKTVQPYYSDSESGVKTFEIRLDDRGYEVGDLLYLYEWDAENKRATGAWHMKKVKYILRGAPFLPDGYVCMAVIPVVYVGIPPFAEGEGEK